MVHVRMVKQHQFYGVGLRCVQLLFSVEAWLVPCRRAKRLKKLTRMLTSKAAQTATDRFRSHTWALIAVLMVAHVACFGVLMYQVSAATRFGIPDGHHKPAIEGMM